MDDEGSQMDDENWQIDNEINSKVVSVEQAMFDWNCPPIADPLDATAFHLRRT